MLLEHYRDDKLKKLYQMLTRSDFKGNFEDNYILSVLYAMACIDRCQEKDCFLKEKDYVILGKEIIRIYDTSEDRYDDYSIYLFTKALLKYMKEEKKRAADIHRTSRLKKKNQKQRK